MFALRRIPALVSRPGAIRALNAKPQAAFACRSRTALFCAAQAKGTGALMAAHLHGTVQQARPS